MAQTYLLSYHIDPGDEGLFLATSEDGLRWSQIGSRSFLPPSGGTGIMRDPCICQGPDGVFHVAWTTGWNDTGIGLAHSTDLLAWSEATYLPVMDDAPGCINAWAPEIFYDAPSGRFLIHWASSVIGRFPETEPSGDEYHDARYNHRTYYVATTDFQTFTETALLYDGGFNAIDTTLVKANDRHYLIIKDETRYPEPRKDLRIASSADAFGPYGDASPPFSPSWVEGPSVLQVGDEWIVYYDEYSRNVYGAMATKDFLTWRSVSDKLVVPKGAKHATALAVDSAIVEKLIATVEA
jgi:hypothetical protein